MSIVSGPLFLLSAAAVLVAVLVPVLLAPRKNFTYAVLYDGLFEVEAGGEDGPGEASREQVRVVAVELRNSSGLNIERSHYVRPITVGFGGGTRILGAEVIEEDPPGIGATLRGLPEREPERVALEPVLFNDGDMVLLEAVVADARGETEVDGRIAGVRRVAREGRSAAMKASLAAANGIAAVLAVILASLWDYFSYFDPNPTDVLGPAVLGTAAGALVGLVVGDALLILALYRRGRRAARLRRAVLARHLGAGDRTG